MEVRDRVKKLFESIITDRKVPDIRETLNSQYFTTVMAVYINPKDQSLLSLLQVLSKGDEGRH